MPGHNGQVEDYRFLRLCVIAPLRHRVKNKTKANSRRCFAAGTVGGLTRSPSPYAVWFRSWTIWAAMEIAISSGV